MEQHLRVTWDDVIDDGMVDVSGKCHLMYGDFDVADGDARVYEEVADVPSLIPRMEENLADYNSESKVRMCSFACLCACELFACGWLQSPMKLVLFADAIEHVSRICRVLRQVPVGVLVLFPSMLTFLLLLCGCAAAGSPAVDWCGRLRPAVPHEAGHVHERLRPHSGVFVCVCLYSPYENML